MKLQKNFSYSMATCNRLYYVSRVCLRLLRKYTNEIYPNEIPKVDKLQPKKPPSETEDKNEAQLCKFHNRIFVLNNEISKCSFFYVDGLNQSPGSAKPKTPIKHLMSSSIDATTSINQKKTPVENLQLTECLWDVRALLINILCDEIALSVESEGYDLTMEILDECHTTFLSCFNAFYPTNTLKWNCLCDLLMKKDKV